MLNQHCCLSNVFWLHCYSGVKCWYLVGLHMTPDRNQRWNQLLRGSEEQPACCSQWAWVKTRPTARTCDELSRTPDQVSQHVCTFVGVNESLFPVLHGLSKRSCCNVPCVILDYCPVWCSHPQLQGCEGIRGASWEGEVLNWAEMRFPRNDGTSVIY